MKQVTISIPENFYKTFVEFFKHMPDAKIESAETISIPEWHKKKRLVASTRLNPQILLPGKK